MLDSAGALQDRADLGDDLVEMPFSGLVAGQQCDCDINFSQVIITPERDKVVDFTKSYFDANQGVLAKAGIKVASVDDAKKLQWGAQLNTMGASFLADKIQPDKETRIFDKTVDVFAALNAGQIDAIMFDTPIVLGAVEEKQVKDAEVVGQFKTGDLRGRGQPGLPQPGRLQPGDQVHEVGRHPRPAVRAVLRRAGRRARDPELTWTGGRAAMDQFLETFFSWTNFKDSFPSVWEGSRRTSR